MSETTGDEFTADEAAQFEEMKAADTGPVADEGGSDVGAREEEKAAPAAEPAKAPAKEEPPKLVPHAALHEERERRKAVETAMQEQQRRFDAILAGLGKGPAAEPAAPVAEELPAFEQDPQRHIAGKFQTLEQKAAAFDKYMQEQQAQQQQQAALRQLDEYSNSHIQKFRATTPDYEDAVNFLLEARTKELQAAPWITPEQVRTQLDQDIFALKLQAAQNNANVAEVAYGFAKAKGYAPKAAADPAAEATAKLEGVARGQKLSIGVGSQGSAPPSRVDAQAISRMSAEEFERFERKHPDEVRRALGG